MQRGRCLDEGSGEWMKLGIDGCEDLSGRGAFVHSHVEGMAAGRSGESASSPSPKLQKEEAEIQLSRN